MIDDIIDDQKVNNKLKHMNPKTPSMSDIDPEIPITPKFNLTLDTPSTSSFDDANSHQQQQQQKQQLPTKPSSARMLKSRKHQIFETLKGPKPTHTKSLSHNKFK